VSDLHVGPLGVNLLEMVHHVFVVPFPLAIPPRELAALASVPPEATLLLVRFQLFAGKPLLAAAVLVLAVLQGRLDGEAAVRLPGEVSSSPGADCRQLFAFEA
jgi:hypothetical protein